MPALIKVEDQINKYFLMWKISLTGAFFWENALHMSQKPKLFTIFLELSWTPFKNQFHRHILRFDLRCLPLNSVKAQNSNKPNAVKLGIFC